jgi:DNA repair exonuclease SbcCD ATPase subunit
MTTFPGNLKISPEKGINVIFGANHSGKTTIVNSLRYAIFGLSWSANPEGLEKRYFGSRIKPGDRKSLEIDSFFNVEKTKIAVRRIVSLSGGGELKCTMSTDASTPMGTNLIGTYSLENEYRQALQEKIGFSNSDYLKILPSLVFAEENRQTFLWMKNIDSFVLGLLASKENVDKLRAADKELQEGRKVAEALRRSQESLEVRLAEARATAQFFEKSLSQLEESNQESAIEEFKSLKLQLDDSKKRSTEISYDLQALQGEKSNLEANQSKSRKELVEAQGRQYKLNDRITKSLVNPDDPKATQLGRYFYFERKCPFCSANLTDEINWRISNGKCAICGKGELTDYRIDDTVAGELKKLEQAIESLCTLISNKENELQKTNEKIENTSAQLRLEQANENRLTRLLTDSQDVERDLLRKEVLSGELSTINKQAEIYRKELLKLQNSLAAALSAVDEITDRVERTKSLVRDETSAACSRVGKIFSEFIRQATNGEHVGILSAEFIPTYDGRQIPGPEDCSQSERSRMDIAFRIGLMSVLAGKSNTTPTLVLETPDEICDESYRPYLAKAICKFSNNLSIIVTTFSIDMMKNLLTSYNSDERRSRLANLIPKGDLTQQKHYQNQITSYLGS